MSTQKIAEKFAGEPVEYVGSQSGTRYADGGEDREEYFESVSGKQHIVVAVPHKSFGSEKPWAHKSDGVVW